MMKIYKCSIESSKYPRIEIKIKIKYEITLVKPVDKQILSTKYCTNILARTYLTHTHTHTHTHKQLLTINN